MGVKYPIENVTVIRSLRMTMMNRFDLRASGQIVIIAGKSSGLEWISMEWHT